MVASMMSSASLQRAGGSDVWKTCFPGGFGPRCIFLALLGQIALSVLVISIGTERTYYAVEQAGGLRAPTRELFVEAIGRRRLGEEELQGTNNHPEKIGSAAVGRERRDVQSLVDDDCMNASSLDDLLACRSIKNAVVISLSTSRYVDLAVNWVCHWNRVKWRNTIVQAVDRRAYLMLREVGVPSFFFGYDALRRTLQRNGPWESKLMSILNAVSGDERVPSIDVVESGEGLFHPPGGSGGGAAAGNVSYGDRKDSHWGDGDGDGGGGGGENETQDEKRVLQIYYTLYRALFVERVLSKGYDVFVSDLDAVVLREPDAFFDPSLDFQGTAQPSVSEYDRLISDGFLFIRASTRATILWRQAVIEYARKSLSYDHDNNKSNEEIIGKSSEEDAARSPATGTTTTARGGASTTSTTAAAAAAAGVAASVLTNSDVGGRSRGTERVVGGARELMMMMMSATSSSESATLAVTDSTSSTSSSSSSSSSSFSASSSLRPSLSRRRERPLAPSAVAVVERSAQGSADVSAEVQVVGGKQAGVRQRLAMAMSLNALPVKESSSAQRAKPGAAASRMAKPSTPDASRTIPLAAVRLTVLDGKTPNPTASSGGNSKPNTSTTGAAAVMEKTSSSSVFIETVVGGKKLDGDGGAAAAAAAAQGREQRPWPLRRPASFSSSSSSSLLLEAAPAGRGARTDATRLLPTPKAPPGRRQRALSKVLRNGKWQLPKQLKRNVTADADGVRIELHGLSWGRFRSNLRTDGRDFFMAELPQQRGEWPIVVHVDHVQGAILKRERMVRASLWAVSDDNRTCKHFPGEAIPPPKDPSKIQFKLIVFTFDRPKQLSDLLRSLEAADYTALPLDDVEVDITDDYGIDVDVRFSRTGSNSLGSSRSSSSSLLGTSSNSGSVAGRGGGGGGGLRNAVVALDIFLDYPSAEVLADEDGETMRAWKACLRLAESFVWAYGPKRVIPRHVHSGLIGQWLTAWNPDPDSEEIAMIIEDDHVLSTKFFFWLQSAVRKYYVRSYDPRLYGISLEYQHQINGRSVYGRPLSDFVPNSTVFYRGQLVSTWCPVFFPRHWAAFLRWRAEVIKDPSFLPFFSDMMTNFFHTQGQVWSSWIMRFVGERGLYSLNTNFKNRLGLVVNQRARGAHFNADKGPDSPLYEGDLEPYMLDFPSMDDLPLYDFHMNLVRDDPSVLEGRANYTDIYNVALDDDGMMGPRYYSK